jgi:hypothetical protein
LRLLPSHTTVHTGPYTAVRWIKRGRSFTPAPKAQPAKPAVSVSVPSNDAVRASPFPVAPKARYLEFGRLADTRSPHLCVLPAFRPSAKLASPTMPSADFCAAVRLPYDNLSLESGTQRRSPEVRATAFAARPPDLPPRSLMAVDFAIIGSLVRPGRPRYPVLVHRAAALLHASFRPHLAMTPLRFANPSPPSGWIEDFHLQAVVHARHTKRKRRPRGRRSYPAPAYAGDLEA